MKLLWSAWFSGVLTVMVEDNPLTHRVYEWHGNTWLLVTDRLHPQQSNAWEQYRIDPAPVPDSVAQELTVLAAEEIAR
ncbi:hypothetical protein [Catenuloplanes japonicus]|uniref:hypothetical protein n=1 Tax=Catenuloplanes japonicus TaxID=33876 RepID=UPI00068D8AA6|nr:hypothetical protein [Catenuloplanes japonicus]